MAAACLALLSVAAVATRAPDGSDDRLTQAPDRRNGAVDLRTQGSESPTPDDDSPTGAPATPKTAGESSRKAGRGDRGVGAGDDATTTTTEGDGATTTSLGGATTTTTRSATGPKCPNPETCDVYKLIDENSGGPHGGTKGWRPDADGIVRIRFYVNPAPPEGSGLTEDTMETAFLEAARIVEAANPRVKYVYLGRTTRVPRSLDGFNDFAFGDRATIQHDSTGHIREADISAPQFVTAGEWAYTPCEQRNGGCGNSGSGKGEILTRIVHEMVHPLGLADLFGDETTELTMDSEPDEPGVREKATLGLGDVLGIRALYPTSAPMPPIYSP